MASGKRAIASVAIWKQAQPVAAPVAQWTSVLDF